MPRYLESSVRTCVGGSNWPRLVVTRERVHAEGDESIEEACISTSIGAAAPTQ